MLKFVIGYKLGSSKAGRRAVSDMGDALAPIFITVIILGWLCWTIGAPVAMIVGSSKLMSIGFTGSASELIMISALAVFCNWLFGWIGAAVSIPEIIAPKPEKKIKHGTICTYYTENPDYEKDMSRRRKVLLISWLIAIVVLVAVCLMTYFAITGIIAGSFVSAGVLLIVLASLSIPFGIFATFAMMN